jgi:hypothetical protein
MTIGVKYFLAVEAGAATVLRFGDSRHQAIAF